MKIKEIITELFNQSTVPFKWSDHTADCATATFTVGKIPYKFLAARSSSKDWDVLFMIDPDYAANHQIAKYGVTGTGNSTTIMATVVNIIKEFLEDYLDEIQVLEFSAAELSRQKLYARMVQRLLPGWTMEQEGKYFTLTRPDVDAS